MKLNIQNPRFQFDEKQTKDIMIAAYHLSQASEHLMESNGMLALIYNAQAMELLDQAGLSHQFINEMNDKQNKPEIKLTKKEKKEVDDLFEELMSKNDSKTNSKTAKKESKNCDCKES